MLRLMFLTFDLMKSMKRLHSSEERVVVEELQGLTYRREQVPRISMARVNESGVVRCPGSS